MQHLTIASTKLKAPARRPDVLERRRLLEKLREGVSGAPLTLVSAPAGTGKTTLLAELPREFPEIQWGWLLLDEEDNDPSRFWAALRAAMHRVDPALTEGIGEGPVGDGRQVVTAIINNVSRMEDRQFGLVLDDLHVIVHAEIHRTGEYMLDRLPPNLRVVIGTRHDPPVSLARRFARGDAAEIRMSDLSFTREETSSLADRLGLSLAPEEIEHLYQRTEGWAAALRLLTTSIVQSGKSVAGASAGSMHGSRRVFDFLAEEVLDRQPAELRRFLLETSILHELNPQVCDALTGRTDSVALLEDLYRRGLYVVAADQDQTNYRYHDLFADFLRERLRREGPAEWMALNVRAGLVEPSSYHRVRHFLAGEDWARAVEEIQRAGPDYVQRGFVATLRRWIEGLPAEVRGENPRILYLLGNAIWTDNEFAQAEPYLEQALDGFRRLKDAQGEGETLVALANSALMRNQFERTRELLQEAMQFDVSGPSRVQIHTASAWSSIHLQDWSTTTSHIDEVIRLGADALTNPLALQLILFSHCLEGYVDKVEQLTRSLRERLPDRPSLMLVAYHLLSAVSHRFRGDLAASLREAAMAEKIAMDYGDVRVVGSVMATTGALVAGAQGQWEEMERAATRGRDEVRLGQIARNWRLHFLYFQGRARLQLGNIEGLRATYEDAMTPNPNEGLATRPYRTLIRGMLRVGERAHAQAEAAFREALREEEAFRITRAVTTARSHLGYLLFGRGERAEALEVFAPALRANAKGNTPGILMVDNPMVVPLLRYAHEKNVERAFAERVLEALSVPLDAQEAAGGEALSDRELEVLRVMAEGLANREIGERFFVSEATVKTHVQRILRKLDAATRTQAVARARERMLI